MYPKKVVQETAKVLQSYLTYQAVRIIINELSETNPTLAIWLSHYSSTNNIQDGEAYLTGLMTDNKELMLRIMTVREHLAGEILEFLPEMVKTSISKANIEHRRQLLERLTRSQTVESTPQPETSETQVDVDHPSD
jgi:hypothetical protein